jgi:hypothetical protein
MALLCLSLVVVLRRAGLEPGCGHDRMIERRRTGRELIRDSIPILFLALCRTSLEQCPSTHPIFLLMIISKRDTTARHMAPLLSTVSTVSTGICFFAVRTCERLRQSAKFRGLKELQRVATMSTVSASKVSHPNAAMYVHRNQAGKALTSRRRLGWLSLFRRRRQNRGEVILDGQAVVKRL